VFIIGIDPHKGSHTAVVIGGDERLVGADGTVFQPEQRVPSPHLSDHDVAVARKMYEAGQSLYRDLVSARRRPPVAGD
jgi:hypothetical protein